MIGKTSRDSKTAVTQVNAPTRWRKSTRKHLFQRWTLTLEGGDVARDEDLEVGAGLLEKVLDVPPGRQQVFLLHPFGAAGHVLGHTHLEVGLCQSLTSNVTISS